MTAEEFRAKINEGDQPVRHGSLGQEVWDWLARRIYYISRDFSAPRRMRS